jgi:hypothetical protein
VPLKIQPHFLLESDDMFSYVIKSLCLLIMLPLSLAEARTWSSKNGSFQIEGEAVIFNEELVVLKKPTGELVAIELADLSDADREFVKSKETKETQRKSADEIQTWTAKDGMQVRGRILSYGRRDVVVQRKFGFVHIDGKKFSTLDPLHQRLTLRVISELEKTKLENERQLEEWAKSLGAAPKTYTLDGVMMQLESGDEIGVPFFMFSKEDLEVLRPGWEVWLEQKESEEAQEKESFLMRAQAMAYQQDRAASQQIEMMKLDLLAAATGIVEIWQIALEPRPGFYGRPITIMVPAMGSGVASQIALQRYPGYMIGGIRRASRR